MPRLPPIAPYNPLDLHNLADQLRRAVENQPTIRISAVQRFLGAGLYALYYTGDFPLYLPLSELAEDGEPIYPIYVGKAVSSSARKGGDVAATVDQPLLFKRVQKHMESITAAASTLRVDDFLVRPLVTQPVWIPLAETGLIARYRPLWNVVLDGFGNNDPGARRRGQYRSFWDHIHPGRPTAALHPVNPGYDPLVVAERIRQHLSGHHAPAADFEPADE